MIKNSFDWAVIGAGPAGIAAVGKLLDEGVSAASILWLDPEFKVGDLGKYWKNVSSNTTVKLFLSFLNAIQAFQYEKAKNDFELNKLLQEDTCLLKHIVDPLQWVTEQLQNQVMAITATVHEMNLHDRQWVLQTTAETYVANNVILAQGAVPKYLNHAGIQIMPFETAIDKERLRESINTDETYAVFGSSHSAIIIINYLVDLGIKRIINFYRSPCCYAINMGEWILFDNTGLKGQTAVWARKYIDGIHPKNLTRHLATEQNIARYLPECDKAIYAVGFKRRNNITISDCEHVDYNPKIGIIGPGLFGFGIAYPEIKADPFGNVEQQVGLWKFMTYLNKVMPIWLKYPA